MADSDGSAASHCWLEGDRYVVLARRWAHGEDSGFTAVRVFARIDEYESTSELTNNLEWPETTSEALAKDLGDGKLQTLELAAPDAVSS